MIYEEFKGDLLLEPYVSISPRSISLFRRAYDTERHCCLRHIVEHKENLLDNRIKQGLSEKAKSRIRRAIDFMELTSPVKVMKMKNGNEYRWKMNFLTLHIPMPQFVYKINNMPVKFFKISDYEKGLYKQNFTDKEVKSKCLNQFLVEIRKKYNVVDYIWKAETQKNGNIHFHLTTNVYLPQDEVRLIWNRCLNKLKMVDYYAAKFGTMDFREYSDYRKLTAVGRRPSLASLKTAYAYGKETAWRNPNTTDIHSTKKIKNMAAYLTEYIAKNTPDSRLIDGRLWYLSKSLTSYKNKVVPVDEEIRDEIGQFLIKENLKHYTVFDRHTNKMVVKDTVDKGEYVWLFKIPFYKYMKYGMTRLYEIFSQHLRELRHGIDFSTEVLCGQA